MKGLDSPYCYSKCLPGIVAVPIPTLSWQSVWCVLPKLVQGKSPAELDSGIGDSEPEQVKQGRDIGVAYIPTDI